MAHAAYLAFIFPLALDRFKPFPNYLIYGLIIGALIVTKSSSSMVAVLAGYITYAGRTLLIGWRRLVVVGLIGVIPAYVFFIDRPAYADWDRWQIWKTTIQMVPLPGQRRVLPANVLTQGEKKAFLPESTAWLIGYGASGYAQIFPHISGQDETGRYWFNYPGSGPKNIGKPGYEAPNWNLHAHNEYLQVLFEHGLIGLVMVFGFIYWLFRRTRGLMGSLELRRCMGAVVAILVHSFLNPTFHVAQLAVVAVVVSSGVYVLTER